MISTVVKRRMMMNSLSQSVGIKLKWKEQTDGGDDDGLLQVRNIKPTAKLPSDLLEERYLPKEV